MVRAPNSALPALLAPALALLAALPYLAAGLGPTFLPLDDPTYITFNAAVRRGLSLSGLRWALGTFYADNWHPLTWLSHMTDVSLFGLDPRGHHAVGLALHALGTAALFVALFRMTGAPLRSAFVAALFGVHPLHVESVAWVAERKDVLSGLLFALVLLAYERYARRPGAARYLAVALLLTLGLMSKATLVATPAVLLLLDFWPLDRLRGARGPWALLRSLPILDKLPLLALSIGCAVPTVALLFLSAGIVMKLVPSFASASLFHLIALAGSGIISMSVLIGLVISIVQAKAGKKLFFLVNVLIVPVDGILTEITNDAIRLVDPNRSIDLAANVWFSIGSVIRASSGNST